MFCVFQILYAMIPVTLATVLICGWFYVKSDETVYLCRKLCVGDFEDIVYENRKGFA